MFTADFKTRFASRDSVRAFLDGLDVSGVLDGRDPLNKSLFMWANSFLPNYILNLLLFVDIVVTAVSGILISKSALHFLGITLEASRGMRGLHGTAANLSLVLIGLHVALHWSWIVNAVKKYVLQPFQPTSASPAAPKGNRATPRLSPSL